MSETVEPPIEVTTRYATTVGYLSAAWAFVMDRLDSVGPDPSIHITPLWSYSVQDMDRVDAPEPPRQFSVVVEGMVPESTPAPPGDSGGERG
jgi:hypothetical protein